MKRQITALARPCPVCLTVSGYILGTLNYEMLDNSPLASSFNVTACDKCGLVTSNTPSTQVAYDLYYTEREDKRTYEGILTKPGPFLHVIEHLVDVEAAIKRIWSDGRELVYVEVPNTGLFTDKPLGYFYYTHLLHLDRLHLQNLFTSKGFRCLSWGFKEYQGIPTVSAVFYREKGIKHHTPDFSLAEKVAGWFEPAQRLRGIE